MTSYLCELTEVSRSGYYKWLRNSEKQAIREEKDYRDYLLLKSIYDASKEKIASSRWVGSKLYNSCSPNRLP